MTDLYDHVRIEKAYFKNQPLGAGLKRTGAGLLRTGGGLGPTGGNPLAQAAVTALTPTFQRLAEKGIERLPGVVWKGVKKVGSWFKKLFGGGMVPMPSGMRMEDMAIQPCSLNKRQHKKYTHRLSKIKGGSAQGLDADKLMTMLMDKKHTAKLGSKAKKPHKFINYILKHQGLN